MRSLNKVATATSGIARWRGQSREGTIDMPHDTSDVLSVKICHKCLTEKPATPQHFFRSKKSADGLTTECKVCRKERQIVFDKRMAEQGVPLICEWCKQTFQVSPRRVEGRRFCSNACTAYHRARQKGQQTRKHRPCERCGKIYLTHSGNRVERQRFCSDTCRLQWFIEYSQHEQCGENNPYWNPIKLGSAYYGPTWHSARKAARKRDNETCQMCGATADELGYQPSVHHIVPFVWFGSDKHMQANRLENLVCYCRICHMKSEWKIREMLKTQSVSRVKAKLQKIVDARLRLAGQLEIFNPR